MDLPPAIYEEAEVPGYSLPALMARDEMIVALEDHVYGRTPDFEFRRKAALIDSGTLASARGARREQWRVEITTARGVLAFVVVVFLPEEADVPVPVFLGLNFDGNHTVAADPAMELPWTWCPEKNGFNVSDNRASELDRGKKASRWPVSQIVERGYGLATVYCGDFAPDDPEHWRDGVARIWGDEPESSRPGAISAWAWGLSVVRRILAEHPRIDAGKIAAIGHSRLGKTSLWAGAQDEAFALVISNESGCGGAALSRRRIGERLVHINTRFPHWFTPRFSQYNEREMELPVDQHQLLATIAPRALYVASAQGDQWADPSGEYLALAAAAPAWNQALPDEQPALDKLVAAGSLGYHRRPGKHDITDFDWMRFLDFADSIWK